VVAWSRRRGTALRRGFDLARRHDREVGTLLSRRLQAEEDSSHAVFKAKQDFNRRKVLNSRRFPSTRARMTLREST
jgi:hypothetical protein